MVMSTMPIKYAVPAGSARTRLLTACAARYTGCTVRGWDVWDGLDTHPASQNSGRFGYSFGKTRISNEWPKIRRSSSGTRELMAPERGLKVTAHLERTLPSQERGRSQRQERGRWV